MGAYKQMRSFIGIPRSWRLDKAPFSAYSTNKPGSFTARATTQAQSLFDTVLLKLWRLAVTIIDTSGARSCPAVLGRPACSNLATYRH
jgi:hypothetical protein